MDAPIQKLVLETIAIVKNLEPQQVTMDSNLAALGLDSLGLFTVIGHIEAALGIEFEVDDTMTALAATTAAELAASLAAVVDVRRRAEEGRG
jgi:acyl carrier protein